MKEPVNYFELYRTEPEIVFPFPRSGKKDKPLILEIAKLGGGSLNEEYVGNWIYGLRYDGSLICSGTDLVTRFPADHATAAHQLIEGIVSTGEPVIDETAHADRLEAWLDAMFAD